MDEYTNQSHFKATEMYQVYREFAEAIDTNVLRQKRITDQLRGVRDAENHRHDPNE